MCGSPAERKGARGCAGAAGRPAPVASGAAAGARIEWNRRTLAALTVAALAVPVGGCYAPEMVLLKSGLDSLRTQVDTLTVRDSIAYAVLGQIRSEIVSQRDLLLSTRASSGSSTSDLYGQMGRLESKLDEGTTVSITLPLDLEASRPRGATVTMLSPPRAEKVEFQVKKRA